MTVVVNLKINFLELTLIENAIDHMIVSMKNHLETQALFEDDHSELEIDIRRYMGALQGLKDSGEEAFQDSKVKGVSDFELPSFFSNVRIYLACLFYFEKNLKVKLAENKFTPHEREICFEKIRVCEHLTSYLTQQYDAGIAEMASEHNREDES